MKFALLVLTVTAFVAATQGAPQFPGMGGGFGGSMGFGIQGGAGAHGGAGALVSQLQGMGGGQVGGSMGASGSGGMRGKGGYLTNAHIVNPNPLE